MRVDTGMKWMTNMRLSENQFVSAMFNLYDKAYLPKESDWEEKVVRQDIKECSPNIWYFIPFFRPKKTIKLNKGLEIALQQAQNTFITDPNQLDLATIEKFCDFVRVAEKIAFYRNDKTNRVVVDSTVSDSEKRMMVRDESFSFQIRTCKNKGASENNMIELNVDRNYGKKMNNFFSIVDRKTQFNDDSDIYLMNSINLVLMNAINTTLQEVYDTIRNKQIEGTY